MNEPNDWSYLSLEDAERLTSTIPDGEVEPGPPSDDLGDDVDEDLLVEDDL